MKILYWSDLFLPTVGGVETFSADLIPALQERGHEVTVLSSSHDEVVPSVSQVGSMAVHRFPIWKAINTRDMALLISTRRAVTAFKQQLNPDIIHLHFGATAFMHMQTRVAIDAPTLTTVHAVPERSLAPDSLLEKLVHTSQAVNAVSSKGVQILNKAFPEFAERFSYIYYGLKPSKKDIVEVTPSDFEKPLILCLGRLVPQKGFDLALRAFAQVEAAAPTTRMMIVGDGPENDALRQLALTLGISEKVEFTGEVPPEDVFAIINSATMLLLPSRFEGLPLVALQAARMQRPIISSDVDGLPELIIDGESGLVLAENNVEHIAEAILTFIQDPEAASRMGQSVGKRFEEYFNFDQCVDRYEVLYEKICRS